LDAELKRKKFAITIGDELPAGIIQMAKVYIAKKVKSSESKSEALNLDPLAITSAPK